MTATQCKRATIEARDIAADTATLEQRIEAYRDRKPAPDARLIVDPDAQQVSREGHIPEITPAQATTLIKVVARMRGAWLKTNPNV